MNKIENPLTFPFCKGCPAFSPEIITTTRLDEQYSGIIVCDNQRLCYTVSQQIAEMQDEN